MPARADIAELDPIYRGDSWEGIHGYINYPGFDFTDVTARCFIRKNVDGPALVICDVTVTPQALGALLVNVHLTADATRILPLGTVYGDVELYRQFPRFGPKTWIRFQLDVVGDVTYTDSVTESVTDGDDSMIICYGSQCWQVRIIGVSEEGIPHFRGTPI